MPQALPLIKGQRFNRWTVLGEARRGIRNRRVWLCRCECGRERKIEPGALKKGLTKSCGCLRDDKSRARIRHGFGRAKNRRPEYSSWAHMIQRCTNPANKKYSYYGGRGISIHKPWLDSFESFLADLGECPGPGYSIDRIDVNGNYEPGNCRWATRKEQSRNTRTILNLRAFGESLTLSEWAERFKMHRSTLVKRIESGMPLKLALKTPILKSVRGES